MILNQSELKQALHYEPTTGVFTWAENRSSRARKGLVAGTVSVKTGGKSYRQVQINGKLYLERRLAVLYMTGKWPDHETGHVHGCGLDNRWVNIRQLSSKENCKNKRLPSNNKSGHVGVCWKKTRGRWDAEITSNGKCKWIGSFERIEDAVEARRNASIEYGFHENHGQVRPL